MQGGRAEWLKRDFRFFVEQVRPRYQWYQHCQRIAAVLQQVADGEIKRLMILCPPRHGKPVYNRSMILLAGGCRKVLEAVEAGDEVITHRGRARRVLAVHEQGELPVLRIVTESGRAAIAAHDHPFLTTEGWKRAADLEPGMVLANVPRPECVPSQAHRTPEEFRLAGYFVGDGQTGFTSKGAGFAANITCFDPAQSQDIHHCAAVMGFGCHAPGNGKVHLKTGVRPWLREAGLAGKNSYSKRVPSWVFEGNREQVGQFLGAYFACDGSVNQKGKARKDCGVEFYSVHRALLEDVQHLLLRLGVQSRIARKEGTYLGEPHLSFRLAITSQDDVARFIQTVPVIGAKAQKLAAWGIRRRKFDEVLLPDAIVAVEDAGVKPCRCLTVDEDHTFTADDLVVHNSETTSRLFTAYYLNRYPDRWVGVNSYAADLAYTLSRASRENYLAAGGPFSRMSMGVGHWETGKGGGLWAAGVGGPIAGKGFNLGIIDDPLKNAEEASSEVIRARHQEWYQSTFYTREEPGGAIILIMTRWHELDLGGWLLSEEQGESPEGWHVLHLPAFREDPLDLPASCSREEDWREEGEALCPERYPSEKLEKIRDRISGYYFSALYQGKPRPREGTIFRLEWLPIRDAAPVAASRIRAWDLAASDSKDSDFSVGTLMARTPEGMFATLHVRRGQWTPAVRDRIIGDTAKEDGPGVPIWIEQEPGSGGKAQVDAIIRQLPGYAVRAERPTGDLRTRAEPWAAQCEAGNFYFARGDWNRAVRDELLGFDTAAHDDCVASGALAFNKLAAKRTLTAY